MVPSDPCVSAALAEMAMFRQAEVDDLTLELYSAKLAQEEIPVDVIVTACETIGRTPRREGETAFPDLGTMLAACRKAWMERANRTAQAQAPKALPAPERPDMTKTEAKRFIDGLRAQVEARRRELNGR
jgi:hypothetical protein